VVQLNDHLFMPPVCIAVYISLEAKDVVDPLPLEVHSTSNKVNYTHRDVRNDQTSNTRKMTKNRTPHKQN